MQSTWRVIMTASLTAVDKCHHIETPKEISANATVNALLKYVDPVSPDVSMTQVFELFLAQPELHAIPVVINESPLGLITRSGFIEFFSKPYARSLYGSKPISKFEFNDSIIVDHNESIDDLARIIIDAGMQHMYDGFIITRNERYVGMGTGHDLLNEITERKQAHLYYLAHYDQLTGLPNRLLLMDRLMHACAQGERDQRLMAVIFLDIDRFKLINDSYGHHLGDELLKAVTTLLQSCLRASDTVARLGGDEFIIILEGVKHLDNVTHVAQKIIEVFSTPLTIQHHELRVSSSIGIVLYPFGDESCEGLLKMADVAMYHAKNKGGNGYQYYSHKMSESVYDRLYIEDSLRKALDQNCLSLHYQPQIEIKTGDIVGLEALVRWHHPKMGAVAPSVFIPIAEESGLIIPLGERVLRMACEQNKRWQQAGYVPVKIAVNLSACQMRRDLPVLVQAVLDETGLDAKYLELELTENILLENVEESIAILRELSDIGVQASIDDFGTGYSSLSYLQRLPIDTLKIDASFLKNIQTLNDDITVVTTIIAMGKNMRLNVIAEGVETQLQLDMLRVHQCDQAQGYLISHPLAAEKIAQLFSDTPSVTRAV